MAHIGILGGTFDPIHLGHVEIAQTVWQALRLDDVILLPDGNPPHKHRAIDSIDRWNMTKLAAEEYGLTASDAEVLRDGMTYTVDTMRIFRKNYPNDTFIYIIGADTLHVLDTWRDFPTVAKLTEFAVIGRAGYAPAENTKRMEELYQKYGAVIHLLEIMGREVSSTQARILAAEGKNVSEFVPKSAAEYIDRNGLYLTDMSIGEVKRCLEGMLPARRWQHTLGVADTARELAAIHHLHPAHAYLAGLLHDAAKPLPYDTLCRLAENAPDVDKEEMECEQALHAPVSAVLAYRDFGVRCPEILNAIRNHTLGGAGMSPFEALIYVSDFIEPNRKPFEGLEEARQMAKKDILAAAKLCARHTVEYVRTRGGSVHPRTLRMLES